MSRDTVRLDGEVVELVATEFGNELVLKGSGNRVVRIALRELLVSGSARVISDRAGPAARAGGRPGVEDTHGRSRA
jgi:hypothetical protein